MTNNHRNISLIITLSGALALSACGKQEPAAPPPPPPKPVAATPVALPAAVPAPAPVTAPATTLRTDVMVGNAVDAEGNITKAGEVFAPKDTIYAMATTNSNFDGNTMIAVKWTFGDGQLVNSSEQKITAFADGRGVTTTFHISKPDGWPVGKYQVETSIDGKVAGTTKFEVK